MEKITFKRVHIHNKNVSNFAVLMDGLELAAGEGCLGLVTGPAGRGKTDTAIKHASHNGCIYLRMHKIWRTSELEFLKRFCMELGLEEPPKRKGPCYYFILDQLRNDPRPVFLDELEKLPRSFLDVIRDISDETAAPFVLIGEAGLEALCLENKRVWSRIFQSMKFAPISAPDIMLYTRESTGMALNPQAAQILHKGSGGDFRLVKRNVISLVQIANSRGTADVTEEMAHLALKVGVRGSKSQGGHEK